MSLYEIRTELKRVSLCGYLVQGVDYLKYDNCYNDGSKPQERYFLFSVNFSCYLNYKTTQRGLFVLLYIINVLEDDDEIRFF